MQGPSLEEIIRRREAEWGGVKRDMEVIREIVQHIEARTDLVPRKVVLEGRDDLTVQAHVWMLQQAGMLNTIALSHAHGSQYPLIQVRDLSGAGHDLAATLSETGWDRLAKKFSPAEIASMTLKGIVDVGTALGVAAMTKAFGGN